MLCSLKRTVRLEEKFHQHLHWVIDQIFLLLHFWAFVSFLRAFYRFIFRFVVDCTLWFEFLRLLCLLSSTLGLLLVPFIRPFLNFHVYVFIGVAFVAVGWDLHRS